MVYTIETVANRHVREFKTVKSEKAAMKILEKFLEKYDQSVYFINSNEDQTRADYICKNEAYRVIITSSAPLK